MKIKKAKKQDLKKIAEIFKKEYAKKPYNERWNEKESLLKIKEYFKNNKIFVAVIDNEIKGFIIFSEFFWDKGKEGFIDEIVIDSKEQSKGIGGTLIKFVENYFKKKGIKKVSLMSVTKSKAFKFYKKKGYKEIDFVCLKKKLK